jgi:hypothetical protein
MYNVSLFVILDDLGMPVHSLDSLELGLVGQMTRLFLGVVCVYQVATLSVSVFHNSAFMPIETHIDHQICPVAVL